MKRVVYIVLQPEREDVITHALLLAPSEQTAAETLTKYATFQQQSAPHLTVKSIR